MNARSMSQQSSSSNRGLYLTLIAVVVIVAGLFGVAVLVGGDDEDHGMQTAPVQIEGQPLAPFPESSGLADPATDPAVGQTAPTVSGVTFDGSPVGITADGTPKLLLFLAHWCPVCQREVPQVQDLIDDGRVPSDVQIMAISTSVSDLQSNYPPSEWLEEEGWTSPVLLDDEQSSAAVAYGLTAFPFGVYVDGDNRVVARTAGEMGGDAVEALLQQLSAGDS